MAVKLQQAQQRQTETAEAFRIVEKSTHAGKVLAVAETSTRDLILVRERTVGKVGKDGKRSRDNGTEQVFKRTSSLADFADALSCGLVA